MIFAQGSWSGSLKLLETTIIVKDTIQIMLNQILMKWDQLTCRSVDQVQMCPHQNYSSLQLWAAFFKSFNENLSSDVLWKPGWNFIETQLPNGSNISAFSVTEIHLCRKSMNSIKDLKWEPLVELTWGDPEWNKHIWLLKFSCWRSKQSEEWIFKELNC